MGGVVEGLFGSGKQQTDWDSVMKIIDLQTRLNRTGSEGFFTSNSWTENDDGTWTQKQSLNPALQGGMDRLLARAGGTSGDFSPYSRPAQFDKLLQAKMANQFMGHGLQGVGAGGQGQIPMSQMGFGKPLNNQPNFQQAGMPAPPPQGGPQGQAQMLPPPPQGVA